MYNDANDEALKLAIIEKRQDALHEAYRRHSGSVLAAARRLLRADALAEEVVQEVFVRMWNNPGRFDPVRGSLRAFLLADTHGRSIDLLRSETARRRREEAEAAQAPVTTASVEDEVWQSALGSEVREAVASLEGKERDAIELAYWGGHTYRDVAAMLGEAEGTVKSRIRSGLKRLRDSLTQLSDDAAGGGGS